LVKLGDIERENNYYLKTLPLWIIVFIDDFLCYGNRVSFLHQDYPKNNIVNLELICLRTLSSIETVIGKLYKNLKIILGFIAGCDK
jgi:hypothetical protein